MLRSSPAIPVTFSANGVEEALTSPQPRGVAGFLSLPCAPALDHFAIMAFRRLEESPKEAVPGQILLVVRKCIQISYVSDSFEVLARSSTGHELPAVSVCIVGCMVNKCTVADDFEARSPDELSLVKGDKIELIERDDDFGDGWYFGKHLENGRTGLFPEGDSSTNLSSFGAIILI